MVLLLLPFSLGVSSVPALVSIMYFLCLRSFSCPPHWGGNQLTNNVE